MHQSFLKGGQSFMVHFEVGRGYRNSKPGQPKVMSSIRLAETRPLGIPNHESELGGCAVS